MDNFYYRVQKKVKSCPFVQISRGTVRTACDRMGARATTRRARNTRSIRRRKDESGTILTVEAYIKRKDRRNSTLLILWAQLAEWREPVRLLSSVALAAVHILTSGLSPKRILPALRRATMSLLSISERLRLHPSELSNLYQSYEISLLEKARFP